MDLKQRSSRHSKTKKQKLPVVNYRQKLQLQWPTEGSTIHQRLPDEKYRQRSRHSTTQNTEIVNSRKTKASTDLRTRSEYRSTGKSTRKFGSTGKSTTKSTRYFRSTTQSATRSTLTERKQPPVANQANTMDSISCAHFRSSFQTEVEEKQMKGTHNYRQKDPILQTDLQPNLQEKPPLDLQEDLQEDLQANLQMDLQVKMDLQPDLQGLEGTIQPSSLVSFPLQAETSTEERSTSMGGTCKQGPIHVSGELPWIYNRDLHPTPQIYKDLHPRWIYKTPQLTGHTPPHLRNRLRCQQQQQQHPGNAQTQSIQPQWAHPSIPGLHSGSVLQ